MWQGGKEMPKMGGNGWDEANNGGNNPRRGDDGTQVWGNPVQPGGPNGAPRWKVGDFLFFLCLHCYILYLCS